MVNTGLYLYDGNDWIQMPVLKEVPISVNLSITDVREPDKAKSSLSKSILIPGTKVSDQFFEFIFEADILLNNFDPGIKTPAKFLENEKISFEGDLQLLNIKKEYDGNTQNVIYECQILGTQGSIFVDMGDALLEDIDFSDLNHTLTYPYSGFTPAVIGSGYACGFTDYGFGDITNQTWKFEDLKPGIFEREILLRIFQLYGYTWDSDFLDSSYYKHRIIPCSNEGKLKQDATDIGNAEFYAGKPSTTAGFYTITGQYINYPNVNLFQPALSDGWYYGTYTPPYGAALTNLGTMYFADDSTTPWFDLGGVYSNPYFTCNLSGWYQLSSTNYLDVDIVPPATTTFGSGNLTVYLVFNISESPDGINWTQIAQSTTSQTNFGLVPIQVSNTVTTPTVFLTAGLQYRVYLQCYCTGYMTFLNGGGVPVMVGTSSISIDHKIDSIFFAKITQSELQYGQTIDMNQILPRNVKQKDFFKSIIQSYNLRIEKNRYNPLEYVIEPHGDFYKNTNEAIDYTLKLDTSKDIEVIPMGELDWKSYLFTYKSDSDEYNTRYKEEFNEIYGQELITVTNQFIKGEKTNELIFSPTPTVSNNYNGIVCPKFYKLDNTGAKNMKCNIRVLYWGGAKSAGYYDLIVNGTYYTLGTYYYWGHVDDTTTPTKDLCFDNPKRVYWTIPAQQYTNDDIYGRYWEQFINEITDKDSKIITAYFVMDETDISTFSFRNLIYADLGGGGAYYYVNKVIDYNPLVKQSTKLELLKVKYADPFVSEIIITDYGIGAGGFGVGGLSGGIYQIGSGTGEKRFSSNSNGDQTITIGESNLNMGSQSLIIGEGNIVNGK